VIKLRGHHLVCLQFFRGEGYNREFIANLEDVIGRAEKGEEIEVVEGADDVCRACPALKGDECVAKPGVDAEIREMDKEAASHLGVKVGERVRWQEVSPKVAATPKDWFAGFCAGCDWEKACVERKSALGLI
jgi:hypothetical protein